MTISILVSVEFILLVGLFFCIILIRFVYMTNLVIAIFITVSVLSVTHPQSLSSPQLTFTVIFFFSFIFIAFR